MGNHPPAKTKYETFTETRFARVTFYLNLRWRVQGRAHCIWLITYKNRLLNHWLIPCRKLRILREGRMLEVMDWIMSAGSHFCLGVKIVGPFWAGGLGWGKREILPSSQYHRSHLLPPDGLVWLLHSALIQTYQDLSRLIQTYPYLSRLIQTYQSLSTRPHSPMWKVS